MISGILRPNSGQVEVKGIPIWSLSNDRLAAFRLNTVGFVFQDYHLFRASRRPRTSPCPSCSSADWRASIERPTGTWRSSG